MRPQRWAGLALAVGILAGCGGNSQNAETQKRLEELQKQVAEQQKELEATRQAASQKPLESAGPAPASTSRTPGPVKPGTKTDGLAKDVERNRQQLEATKEALEQTRQATAKNAEAIASNTAAIEKNRQDVEEAKQMAAPPRSHTLAAGTPIVVRTTTKLSTKTNASGSLFEATLEQPLEVDGYLVAPRGALVEGVVTSADEGGRVKGRPTLTVALRSITMADGRRLPIQTSRVSEVSEGSVAKDATKVAIASGVGATIGAIAGGGKGAAIGAGVGAGGGTAGILLTKGKPAEIPAETVLRFSLTADAKFQELKK